LQTKYDRENKPSCLFYSFGKKYDKNHLVNLHDAGLFITSKVEDDVVYMLNMADPKHPDRYVSDVNSLTNESCQYWLNSIILSASLKAQKEAVERMVTQMNPFARLLFKLFYKEPKDQSSVEVINLRSIEPIYSSFLLKCSYRISLSCFTKKTHIFSRHREARIVL
jgi:hypothetical protein